MKRDGWWRALLALLLALAFALPAMAQTNELQPTPVANRYLLVVETSRSMQRRAPGTLKALADLLGSGFGGQIHPGDTLGVWTFAEDLYTGRFPLQHWASQKQTAISKLVLDFLGEQTYEKQPNFDKLLPALDQLVKSSPFITIILVTDGADKIRGTPFDSRINDIFDDWRERQQQVQMPFLTVLRAKRGVVLDYAVTPAPWPLEMPPLPKELQLPEVSVQLQKAAPKPAAPAVPPLIIRGKKADPAKAVAAASAPAPGSVAPEQPVAAPLVSSNLAPALVAKAEPLPAQAPPRLAEPNPAPVPPAPTSSAPAATNQPASAPAAAVHSPAPASPVHNAVALPPSAPASRKGFWLGAAVLAAALLGLVIVVIRRARPAPTASLITRSLERQSK